MQFYILFCLSLFVFFLIISTFLIQVSKMCSVKITKLWVLNALRIGSNCSAVPCSVKVITASTMTNGCGHVPSSFGVDRLLCFHCRF